jgi:hypothetical protein
MLITCKLIKIVLLVVLNISSLLNLSESTVPLECNYFRFINGCEDSEGSHCVDGHCICKDGYTVELRHGFCLKTLLIGDNCMTSSQCSQSDSNSACFSSNDDFSEWVCQCTQNYYYDQNNTNKCLHQLNYGQKCDFNEQCLGENSVCSSHNICVCEQYFKYDVVLKSCKHINNTGCDGQHQWNKFTKKCEIKIHYSNKGGIN